MRLEQVSMYVSFECALIGENWEKDRIFWNFLCGTFVSCVIERWRESEIARW